MPSIVDFIRRRLLIRRVLVLGAHVTLYAASFMISFLLRFDFKFSQIPFEPFMMGLSLIVLLRVASGYVFKLYGGVMKYAGIRDLIDIIKAMSVASFAFVVVIVLLGVQGFPRSIFALDLVGSIVLVGGLRFGMRVLREVIAPAPEEIESGRKRVAIVGAGDAGEALARDLLRTYRDRYQVVCFFDDNPRKRGLRIHDIPVLAPILYLGDYVPRYQIDEVIIAIPSATGEIMRRVVSACKIAGVRFRTIPGIDQLIDGIVTVNQIRDVAIEDLLGREPVHLEEGLIRKFVTQKIVMVTGAGGSIGGELCRQILRYLPNKLIMVEQSEPNLFFIHRELSELHPDVELHPVIADVTDLSRMERVFDRHGPEVIFHAAAHKHVPMMEWNPGEAIKNNVFGTKVVANLAHQFGSKSFVFISTDKAVNPTSVMGASKRVAEMYVQALSKTSQTKYSAVRFGNVLGSVGSVVPIFKEQIQKGGPLTVTDPEMQRYFMTIPESCQLVLQAAAMGEGGEIFVLDMGEPVKIIDLAHDLITLSGFEPGRDIKIVFTGLRPGEKLFEELGFDAEKMNKTRHPKIYTGKLEPHPIAHIEANLNHLKAVTNDSSSDAIRLALKQVVPEFQQVMDSRSSFVPRAKLAQPQWSKPSGVLVPVPQENESDFGNPESPLPAHMEARTKEIAPDESIREARSGRQVVGQETSKVEHPAALTTCEASLPGANSVNPIFSETWDKFVELSKGQGFDGVGWRTHGVKIQDVRKLMFDGSQESKHRVIKRSIPISTFAFVELWFAYTLKNTKKVPEPVKDATRRISVQITHDLVGLQKNI